MDILAAIHSVQDYVSGMDLEAFQEDDKTASAVIRKFEIIGEAAKHVPPDIRNAYSQVHGKKWQECVIH